MGAFFCSSGRAKEIGLVQSFAGPRGRCEPSQDDRRRHPAVVKLLLDREAAVNQADDEGETPLYIAAQEGNLSVV